MRQLIFQFQLIFIGGWLCARHVSDARNPVVNKIGEIPSLMELCSEDNEQIINETTSNSDKCATKKMNQPNLIESH